MTFNELISWISLISVLFLVSLQHISSTSISLSSFTYLISVLGLTSLHWPAVFVWVEDDTDEHL